MTACSGAAGRVRGWAASRALARAGRAFVVAPAGAMLVIWLRRRLGRPRPQQMTRTLMARVAPLVTPGHRPALTGNVSTALTTTPDRRLRATLGAEVGGPGRAQISQFGRPQPTLAVDSLAVPSAAAAPPLPERAARAAVPAVIARFTFTGGVWTAMSVGPGASSGFR